MWWTAERKVVNIGGHQSYAQADWSRTKHIVPRRLKRSEGSKLCMIALGTFPCRCPNPWLAIETEVRLATDAEVRLRSSTESEAFQRKQRHVWNPEPWVDSTPRDCSSLPCPSPPWLLRGLEFGPICEVAGLRRRNPKLFVPDPLGRFNRLMRAVSIATFCACMTAIPTFDLKAPNTLVRNAAPPPSYASMSMLPSPRQWLYQHQKPGTWMDQASQLVLTKQKLCYKTTRIQIDRALKLSGSTIAQLTLSVAT